MVNDHTRKLEVCVCGTSFVYNYIYRVYVDSHSLGQLALASKRNSKYYTNAVFLSLAHSASATRAGNLSESVRLTLMSGCFSPFFS